MTWFLAKLTFEVKYGSSADKNHFEEHTHLVEAEHKYDAVAKAESLARSEEEIIFTRQGETIEWKLLGINSVNEYVPGVPLFTKSFKPRDQENYVQTIRQNVRIPSGATSEIYH